MTFFYPISMNTDGYNIPDINLTGPFSDEEIKLAHSILKKGYCKKAAQKNISPKEIKTEIDKELTEAGLPIEIQYLPELTSQMAKILREKQC